jgi:VWFA-related protein
MYYPPRRLHYINFVAWFILTSLVSPIICGAQQNMRLLPDNVVQSPAVDITRLQVSVTDGLGNHLSGLGKDNFTILVDDKPQGITLFSDEDEPSSICILFDTSVSMGSMRDTEYRKRLGVANLVPLRLAAMSHQSNEYFLITFNERPNILLDGVSGDELTAKLSKPPATLVRGKTAIYDSLRLGIEKLSGASHRKRVILLITDGAGDTASQTKASKLKELASVSGIQIYFISVGEYNSGSVEEDKVMEDLLSVTGGTGFYPPLSWPFRVDTVKALEEFTSFMARDIRSQYTLGFIPIPHDGKWHKMKVKVTPPPNSSRKVKRVVVRSRQKYYAVANSR